MPSTKIPKSFQQDGQDLISKINSLIAKAVKSKFDGNPSRHPLLFVNAVKNIMGDDRENPSIKLLNLSDKYINQFSSRNDDDKILDNIIKEGIGLTVFVEDVEVAIMSGIKEEAELEAAKQLLASDKSEAILECLAELALHDIEVMGLFTYHWMRSYQFHHDKELLWAYTRSMINEIFKANLQFHTEFKSSKYQDLISTFLNKCSQGNVSTFSSMNRLWSDDYVRTLHFQTLISSWLEKWTHEHIVNSEMDVKELNNYTKNGGRYFIELAENIYDKNDINISVNKIIGLEGLRGLVKKATSESFSRIAQCINLTVD